MPHRRLLHGYGRAMRTLAACLPILVLVMSACSGEPEPAPTVTSTSTATTTAPPETTTRTATETATETETATATETATITATVTASAADVPSAAPDDGAVALDDEGNPWEVPQTDEGLEGWCSDMSIPQEVKNMPCFGSATPPTY